MRAGVALAILIGTNWTALADSGPAGNPPGYGRLEIEPPANRKLPQPAESYHDSWSAQSTPQAVQPPVQPEVPFYPPPVILAPQDRGAEMPQDFRRRQPGNVPH